MRRCIRCQAEMIEKCDIKIQGAGYGIVLSSSEKIFAERLGKPKVAICPSCGEVSIYIEDINNLSRREAK